MAIAGKEFASYAKALENRIIGKHISRPILVSRDTLFFHLSGKGDRRFVICLDKSFPRAYASPNESNLSSIDSPVYSLFKKELSNAYLSKVSQENGDRILRLDLTVVNNVYKEETRYLFFEMLSMHPNLILTDENRKIIAYTHGSSLESKRPIIKGISYLPPDKPFENEEKLPFDYESFLSLSLAKENEILQERKKERFGSLLSSYEAKKKRLERKLVSIQNDKDDAAKHIDDALIGDYIYTNFDSIDENREFEFEGKAIELDPNKPLVEIANSFYKKAKKAKNALKEIEKLQKQTEEELEETLSSLSLLKISDEEGLESFAKDWGLSAKKGKEVNIGGANIPYQIEDNGTTYLFGKNAKQNDTLTFLIDTCKTHYWFHIKEAKGSHVMIKKDEPSKEEILLACEFALLANGKSDGDIMMAERKYVYKGNAPGQAIVRRYETVHLKNVRSNTKTLFAGAAKMSLRREK